MGYFGRTAQVSRGPWFAEVQVEDDGLEYYYMLGASYLLSNNMTYKDRTEMHRLYYGHARVNNLAYFAGCFVAATCTFMPRFQKLAWGWKIANFGLAAIVTNKAINGVYSNYYGPLICAYFRKYKDVTVRDPYEIRDRKREFYQIDDSQYMDYTVDDLQNISQHMNHGPQPDGEAHDSSYLTELGAFLDNKPNHLKEHHKFLDYDYEFIDKSYPTVDMAKDLIEGKKE